MSQAHPPSDDDDTRVIPDIEEVMVHTSSIPVCWPCLSDGARRQPRVAVPVHCPSCHSSEVLKASTQANGAQRSQCQNRQCARRILLLQYHDHGRAPEIRRQVVDLVLNGGGVRDTAHVLRISPATVIAI
jgi:transposase-like protein